MWYKQAWYHSNNSMQVEITHTANHLRYELNNYSDVTWKQHSLLRSNIIFRETPGSLVITLKSKKRRMIVAFVATNYKKSLYVHYKKQLHIKFKLKRGKHCQDIVIKKQEFCWLILYPSSKLKSFLGLSFL